MGLKVSEGATEQITCANGEVTCMYGGNTMGITVDGGELTSFKLVAVLSCCARGYIAYWIS